jgi:hypothetical protein
MIYVREGEGQYVGPFKSRKHAKRFIELMELCGENWAGTEVVVVEGRPDPRIPPTDRIQ